VWILADRALAVLAVLAWALLAAVCAVALRESASALERARARVLLWGTLAVVAIPLAAAGSGGPLAGSLGMFGVAAGLLPLPIGYAIPRYRLFDLGLAVRRGIAYLLYAVAASVCAGAGLLAGARLLGTTVDDPPLLFALAFACFLAGEPLRARLRRAIDGWLSPSAARMRAALGDHAREMAQLLDPDQCAQRLCRTLREGWRPSRSASSWRRAAAGARWTRMAARLRSPPPRRRGRRIAGEGDPLHLAARSATARGLRAPVLARRRGAARCTAEAARWAFLLGGSARGCPTPARTSPSPARRWRSPPPPCTARASPASCWRRSASRPSAGWEPDSSTISASRSGWSSSSRSGSRSARGSRRGFSAVRAPSPPSPARCAPACAGCSARLSQTSR
jgi:hypothetical protein